MNLKSLRVKSLPRESIKYVFFLFWYTMIQWFPGKWESCLFTTHMFVHYTCVRSPHTCSFTTHMLVHYTHICSLHTCSFTTRMFIHYTHVRSLHTCSFTTHMFVHYTHVSFFFEVLFHKLIFRKHSFRYLPCIGIFIKYTSEMIAIYF